MPSFRRETITRTEWWFAVFDLTFHGKILLFVEILVNSPLIFFRNFKIISYEAE